MKKAIITIGVSASGKSTWAHEFCAKNHNSVEINRDAIRANVLLHKTGKGFSWNDWKWKWEDEVTEIHRDSVLRASKDPNIHTVIISDTNLNAGRNAALEARLKELGFEVEFKFFEVSYEEAVKRDAARHNGVGAPVIAKQFQDLHILLETHIEQNPKLPPVVLVDIDGSNFARAA